MKKFLMLTFTVLGMSCGDALATNYIKVINTTDKTLRVGLIKSSINFTEMTVGAGMTREYDTGQEIDCLRRVTINGIEVWSGTNYCDNYEITIRKQPAVTQADQDKFTITFAPSSAPKSKPLDPLQGISM